MAPPAWHILATYGQSSAPRSESFAEAGTLSVARDFRLGGNFKLSLELAPFFVLGLTRVDLPARSRETVFAFAALPLLSFDAFPRSKVGLRLEAGAGFVWSLSPVPADGTHGNFYDVVGGRVRRRLPSGSAIAGGLRRTHISNLGVIGQDNPGLSFYAGVLAFEWGR